MAAHLVGFVGQGDQGEDKGVYGLEGFLSRPNWPASREFSVRNTMLSASRLFLASFSTRNRATAGS